MCCTNCSSSVLLGPHIELHIAVGETVLRAWADSVTHDPHPAQSRIAFRIAPSSVVWICE